MKTIKNLLSLSFLILITYSCEPEELPNENNQLNIPNNVSAHGDQDDDVEDRKGNN